MYMVQYNLGGVSGPLEMKFDPVLDSYWDSSGDFDTDGKDTISYDISRKHFSEERDAQMFVEGIKWFLEVEAKKYLENTDWL